MENSVNCSRAACKPGPRGGSQRRSPTELRRPKRGGLHAAWMTKIPLPLFALALDATVYTWTWTLRECGSTRCGRVSVCVRVCTVFRMAPPAASYGRVHTRSRVDFHDVTFQFAPDIDLSFSAHVTNRLPTREAWPASWRRKG